MLDGVPLPVIAAGVVAVVAFVVTSGMGLTSRATGIVCAAVFAYFGAKLVLDQMGVVERRERAVDQGMKNSTLQQQNEALGLKRDVEQHAPILE